ncbi:hypothetical protein EDD85DRAFT_962520 [Armillaria nabsnona]|nr:hypothetical protein EDD85DRAFT_962520 [Armillaria nabsnona]
MNATPNPSPAEGKSAKKPLSINAPRKSGLPPLSTFIKGGAPQPGTTEVDAEEPALTETAADDAAEIQGVDGQESVAEELPVVTLDEAAMTAEGAMRKRKSIDETDADATDLADMEDPFLEKEVSPLPSPLPDPMECREQKKPRLQELDDEEGPEDTARLSDYRGIYDDIDNIAAMKTELQHFEADLITKYRHPTPVPSPMQYGSLSNC